jgi:hypothetical protein
LGTDILIARDKILGLEEQSILSSNLRSQLFSSNFLCLAQVRSSIFILPLLDNWLGSGELNLSGQNATDWDSFMVSLRSTNISLNDEPDSLLWAGGDAIGFITVKNLYTSLLQLLDLGVDKSWLHRLWKWSIPLKYKFFIWLSAKEKVLTWEMLWKKG